MRSPKKYYSVIANDVKVDTTHVPRIKAGSSQ